MRRLIARTALMLLVTAVVAIAGPEALPGFEPMQTGPGTPGRWDSVADDGRTAGHAVEQSSDDPTDGPFLLLTRMATAPANVTVRVRIKPMAGSVDRAGGLAVRLLDRNNYYVVCANALEGNVRFYKVVAGRWIHLAGADAPVPSGVWHDLAVTARDDRFTVSFDGRDLFSATDEIIVTPGKVAFWTKADSVTRFDGLDVEELR